jgi:glycosyltransferase involved in cell wall biosynthesis
VKKILIVTYYWPPSGGAGVQRWLKFVKYLPEFGYEPIVLTVREENASYAQSDPSLLKEVDPAVKIVRTPSFEPYSLYLKLSGKKEIPFGGFSNEGSVTFLQKVFRFIRGNLFIPDPRKGWNRYAVKAAKKIIQQEKIDVVITSGPPHSTHLIGLRLKKQTGIKWIADFRDPWTDIYYYKDLSHTPLAKWYDGRLERKVLHTCDKVITVGYELKNLLASKIETGEDEMETGKREQKPSVSGLRYPFSLKIHVITNGYDTEDFKNHKEPSSDLRSPVSDLRSPVSNLQSPFYITYAGTISSYYRIEGYVSALADLPEPIRSQIKFRFVGNISSSVSDLINKAGLNSQLELTGYVPHDKSISYLFDAGILLLLIPDVSENKGILTGKFFEYLATGKPILAIGPTDGDVARILKETGTGSIFFYDDVRGIKEAILNYFNKRGETHGPNKAIEKYSRRTLTSVLSGIIKEL